MSIFETEAYAESRRTRLTNLFEHVPPASLQGQHVLEMGCGTGELGEEFVKLGCLVTSVDARPEHIEELRVRFPSRGSFVVNLDVDTVPGRFDVALCFGLLYHLANPAEFLHRCRLVAPVLYLETVVLDSPELECPGVEEGGGEDQSFMQAGCRPSTRWLLRTLAGLGYDVKDISGPAANWSSAIFDWWPRHDRKWMRDGATLRKMFICQQQA